MNSFEDKDGLIPNAAPVAQQQHTTIEIQPTLPVHEQTIFQQSSHPWVLFFHLFFRTGAVVVFILPFFISSYVTPFVFVILLSAFDFWTVKNVSGRILVGLRYWNDVKDDGSSVWIYESRSSAEINSINANDARVFWFTLYLFPVIWIVFGVYELLTLQFKWLPAAIIGLMLTSSNLVGYLRCDKDAKAKWKQAIGETVVQRGILSGLLSRFT